MKNIYSGGAKREKFGKKFFSKKHSYSGLVNWANSPTRTRPAQRFQTSPNGDSTSCVAQSKAGHIELFLSKIISAQPIFYNRSNKPNTGMYLSDCDSITLKIGTNTEQIIPSEKLNDTQLDTLNLSPTPIKATGQGVFVAQDADHIADAISHFKGVSCTFVSNSDEWDSPNQTPVYKGTPTTFGHCIFLFDFFLNNGVKTFVANDSDGLWSASNGLRYITEDFLLKRCTGASYNPSYVDTSVITPDQQAQINNLQQRVAILQALINAWTKLKALLAK